MSEFIKARKIDIALLFAVMAVAFSLSLLLSSYFPPKFYQVMDMWFEADVPRVLDNMTSRHGELIDHYRTSVHPLGSILLFPPTKTLIFAGLSAQASARSVLAICAAISVGLAYVFCRLIRASVIDSLIVCGVTISTAAFIFWFDVVETFAAGSATIFLVLVVAAARTRSLAIWIVASAASLSMTVTNWSIGLVASFMTNGWKRFLIITIGALALVVNFAVWQRAFFPSSQYFFLPSAVREEQQFVAIRNPSDVGWIVRRTSSIVFYTGVAPSPLKIEAHQGNRVFDKIIGKTFYDLSPLTLFAVLTWIALILNGAWAAWKTPGLYDISLTLGAFLAIQMGIHVVYGDEPFLYSAHFLPGFMGIIALGFIGNRAWISRAAGCLYCVSGLIANYVHFVQAIALI